MGKISLFQKGKKRQNMMAYGGIKWFWRTKEQKEIDYIEEKKTVKWMDLSSNGILMRP